MASLVVSGGNRAARGPTTPGNLPIDPVADVQARVRVGVVQRSRSPLFRCDVGSLSSAHHREARQPSYPLQGAIRL